jgi:hypothetical protein
LPQLTNYSTLSFGAHYTIIVNLAFYSVDLVSLELDQNLGYTNIDTYFAITGVEDLAGNPAVQGNRALQATKVDHLFNERSLPLSLTLPHVSPSPR